MSGMRIRLNARRPGALTAFYIQALGFERVSSRAGVITLALGASGLEIAACEGQPYPDVVPGWSPLFQHFAVTTSDMAGAMARLGRTQGWTPISRGGPQRLPANTGGVTAFKFRDPEGHPVELIAFPDEPTGAAARIDHSAISVADTAMSVAFYEALGLVVGGRSLNRGPEQDRLDGLDGVEVEVTALRFPGGGAHVELLCYRGDYPQVASRAEPDDVVATRLVWDALSLETVAGAFPAFVVTVDPTDGTLLLHDPDGHLLLMAQAPITPSAQ